MLISYIFPVSIKGSVHPIIYLHTLIIENGSLTKPNDDVDRNDDDNDNGNDDAIE